MIVALAIGIAYVGAVALVLSFSWGCSERRVPTPRPARPVILSERTRVG